MIRRLMIIQMAGILLVASALAQTNILQKTGSDRYETSPETKVIRAKHFTNLSFTASSYISGKLSIRASDVPSPSVVVQKSFKAGSKSQAEDFASYIEFNIEELENEVAISAETKSTPPWSGSSSSGGVAVVIDLPRSSELKIDIRTSVFTIDISGPFASVDISNSVGDISVERVTEKVRVTSDNGAVSVRDCSGPISVNTSSRPILLTKVDGKLGTIKLRNTNSKIQLESVRGEIDARSENSSINGTNVRFETGHSTLVSQNSTVKIDVDAINGDLSIRSENGNIDLDLPANTSAKYSLQVEEGGRIYTRSLPITVETASRTLVAGYAGGKTNKIDIDIAGVGTINLEGKPASRNSPL